MNKITEKIVGYRVVEQTKETPSNSNKIDISNKIDDTCLSSYTFKFKPNDDAYYVTITKYDDKPYSIFINSKDTTHLEALGVLTTLLSMLFQADADIDKIVKACEKMISSGDKSYWGKNWEIQGKKKWYNSIYQEIGAIIKYYNKQCKNEIEFSKLPVYEEQMIDKIAEKIKQNGTKTGTHDCLDCIKIGKKLTAVLLDGCLTCLECGYSKCN